MTNFLSKPRRVPQKRVPPQSSSETEPRAEAPETPSEEEKREKKPKKPKKPASHK